MLNIKVLAHLFFGIQWAVQYSPRTLHSAES